MAQGHGGYLASGTDLQLKTILRLLVTQMANAPLRNSYGIFAHGAQTWSYPTEPYHASGMQPGVWDISTNSARDLLRLPDSLQQGAVLPWWHIPREKFRQDDDDDGVPTRHFPRLVQSA